MKISHLIADNTIGALNGTNIFYSPEYKIEYQRSPEGYMINDTVFIPVSKISYVVFVEDE